MISLLAAALVVKAFGSGPLNVTIRVDSGPLQTFSGFGAGIASETSTGWGSLATRQQIDMMTQKIWGENKFNTARLLMDPATYEPVYGFKDFDDYFTSFITSNRVPSAIRYGAKNLLLSPFSIPPYMDDGTGYIADSQIPYYGALLADFISQFKAKTGWLINWTGILNEPTSSGKTTRFRVDQWPVMIKTLRAKLDSRGLQAVHILAPETSQANADDSPGSAGGIINAIAGDPEAWADLDAVATHSYGVCANPDMVAVARGKPYWTTESGSLLEQGELPGDTVQACTAATRFLIDMNNGVGTWIYYIGNEYNDPPVSSQMSYFNMPYSFVVLQKFYYLQQLSQAFDAGAVFRHCSSSLDGKMVWQNGIKPHMAAAFAKNPDGTFSIGLTNFTSNVFADPSAWLKLNGNLSPQNVSWMQTNSGASANTYTVSVVFPSLANTPSKVFHVYHSVPLGPSTYIGDYPMINGVLTVPQIGSLSLLTMRSVN
ncbi:MAG TPA: hypothetical protein VG944_00895 [Fimbriimonas sp.]|nr:hypothetical protein [Fimbriimonas sp.]